jgi:TRAP-type C4-dicarboxylate transport system substrate-binding protein
MMVTPQAGRTLVGAIGLAVGLSSMAAQAQPAQLKFGFPSPPTSWINTQGITPWTKRVAERSGGTVEIMVFPGGSLGNSRIIFDRVVNGVADFGYNVLGDDAFPRVQVGGLPFESTDPIAVSVALWRLIENGPVAEDFQRVKPIAVFGIPGLGLHSVKPIAKLEDLAGLKLSTGGRTPTAIVHALGATPVTLISAEIYPAVQRGMVQGAATSALAVVTFRLDEVTRYHLDVPFGLTPVGFFMHKDSFARLPEKARAAIDAESGEKLSRIMGEHGANQLKAARVTLATPPHTAMTLDAPEVERWKKKVAPVAEEWVAKTPDGPKVLAAYRAELAKLKAGM